MYREKWKRWVHSMALYSDAIWQTQIIKSVVTTLYILSLSLSQTPINITSFLSFPHFQIHYSILRFEHISTYFFFVLSLFFSFTPLPFLSLVCHTWNFVSISVKLKVHFSIKLFSLNLTIFFFLIHFTSFFSLICHVWNFLLTSSELKVH